MNGVDPYNNGKNLIAPLEDGRVAVPKVRPIVVLGVLSVLV